MDRFNLEETMSTMMQIDDDLDTMIYAIGDASRKYTEDQLLNMLIGMKQLHATRYDKMWEVFEYLVRNDIIKSPPLENIE